MTLPEDPETKCGYGFFNCGRLLKPFRNVWEWHDRVTTAGSEAEKMGIPNERIVEAWNDQIDEVSKGLKGQGFYKQMGRFSKIVIRLVNRFFYNPAKKS